MQAVAVIQEQHGERTRLLNQWKQLKMELLFDPLNRLDVAAVPITLLVDEIGVIRFRNPNEQQLRTFLTSARLEANPNRSNLPDGAALQAGDRLAMNGKLDEAIDWYAASYQSKRASSTALSPRSCPSHAI